MQLTRRQTMKRAFQFAMVRAAGSSNTGRFLVFSTAPHPDGPDAPSLFGIITTKRIGHAVTRNLLRRRLREILRAHGDPLRRGNYVVLIVRSRAAGADYAGLEKEFLRLMNRRLRGHAPSR